MVASVRLRAGVLGRDRLEAAVDEERAKAASRVGRPCAESGATHASVSRAATVPL
jgi:hypothetical protein